MGPVTQPPPLYTTEFSSSFGQALCSVGGALKWPAAGLGDWLLSAYRPTTGEAQRIFWEEPCYERYCLLAVGTFLTVVAQILLLPLTLLGLGLFAAGSSWRNPLVAVAPSARQSPVPCDVLTVALCDVALLPEHESRKLNLSGVTERAAVIATVISNGANGDMSGDRRSSRGDSQVRVDSISNLSLASRGLGDGALARDTTSLVSWAAANDANATVSSMRSADYLRRLRDKTESNATLQSQQPIGYYGHGAGDLSLPELDEHVNPSIMTLNSRVQAVSPAGSLTSRQLTATHEGLSLKSADVNANHVSYTFDSASVQSAPEGATGPARQNQVTDCSRSAVVTIREMANEEICLSDNVISYFPAADVICLQEVSCQSAKQVLMRRLLPTFPFAVHSSQPSGGWDSVSGGLVIMSRYKIAAAESHLEDTCQFLAAKIILKEEDKQLVTARVVNLRLTATPRPAHLARLDTALDQFSLRHRRDDVEERLALETATVFSPSGDLPEHAFFKRFAVAEVNFGTELTQRELYEPELDTPDGLKSVLCFSSRSADILKGGSAPDKCSHILHSPGRLAVQWSGVSTAFTRNTPHLPVCAKFALNL